MLSRGNGKSQGALHGVERIAFQNGERLFDVSRTGAERPWRKKKISSLQLADIYDQFNPKKADRLRRCAQILAFCRKADGGLQLASGMFCHVGLCPMCHWRRARKVYYQMSRIFDSLRGSGLVYIFLTLTVRTVSADDLSSALDSMSRGGQRYTQTRLFRKIVKGCYRGIEITHDVHPNITSRMYQRARKYYDAAGLRVGDSNPNFDLYHPHYHCILAVDKRYFSGRDYVPQSVWAELWKRSMRVDYSPVVDIRRIKGDSAEAIAETCKYTVKESDFMTGDLSYDVQTVMALDAAMKGRRLLSLQGIFREKQKELNLSDMEDLNKMDSEMDGEAQERVSFIWCTGVREYYSTRYL